MDPAGLATLLPSPAIVNEMLECPSGSERAKEWSLVEGAFTKWVPTPDLTFVSVKFPAESKKNDSFPPGSAIAECKAKKLIEVKIAVVEFRTGGKSDKMLLPMMTVGGKWFYTH